MATRKSGIDQDLIRDLAGILKETDLTEIEVEQDDLRIRISRAGTVHRSASEYVHTAHALPAPAAPAADGHAAGAAGPAESGTAPARNTINAPMVGTAYLSPSPGTKPFVEPGQTVKEGQTVMIIEAMKTMNQIPAPRGGVVKDVLVEDGQPVEYGEPLIALE